MTEIAIATRASALALRQAGWVAERLRAIHPGLQTRLVEVATTGDLDRASPVASLTEVGAFVRAVQTAVLEGRADVAVHSCKDLPVAGPAEIEAYYPTREEPWDVLAGVSLSELAPGARVGTGSPRRAAQLLAIRPDVDVEEVRGNVDTRLRKAADGEFTAVVLAEAGLRRLGRAGEIRHRFTLDEMVPAPAQGALAVEVLRGTRATELVAAIDDPATRAAVLAERRVLEISGAGCRAALGALALARGDGVELTGFVADERGPRRATAVGPADEAAAALARELRLA